MMTDTSKDGRVPVCYQNQMNRHHEILVTNFITINNVLSNLKKDENWLKRKYKTYFPNLSKIELKIINNMMTSTSKDRRVPMCHQEQDAELAWNTSNKFYYYKWCLIKFVEKET